MSGFDKLAAALLSPAPLPLPEEPFPRVMPYRTPDKGYYAAMGLVMSVWMITPLSCAYLVWFTLFRIQHVGLTGILFAGYALTEVLFAIYNHYLIKFVQAPSPESTLSFEARNSLFFKVLAAGLEYPDPVPPKSDEADPVGSEMKQKLYDLYVSGHMSKAQYHHALDRNYEEIHEIVESGRVGKMTKVERDVIDYFVESHPGDRELRLKQQIEADVNPELEYEENGVVDKDGNVVKLHTKDRRAVEFRERLRTWFDHAPWENIKRENVLAWLSWSCFGLPYDEVLGHDDRMQFLLRTLEILEARTGWTFPPGFDPTISVIRLTLDPVNAKPRPLLLYAISNTVNWWLREIVYPYQGLAFYKEGGIEYLIRIPKGWTKERGRWQPNAMPVVFLDGLGFGLLQSHLLIKHLIKSLPTHPLVVPLAPHTAQNVFHKRHLRPWSRAELVEGMKAICTKWGFWEEPQTGMGESPHYNGGVSLLSHSNGSVAHGWLLKDCPSIARRSTFVDPVVFCLWEGDVCHSFCYRKPATALELLLYYFIASEVGTANYISRHFDWADNTLFFDEIPNALDPSKTAWFLGGKDIILDAARVRKYLERHGVGRGLHWDSDKGHGDGLSGEARDRVVMFVGTGDTRGWQGWLSHGRRQHSTGTADWKAFRRRWSVENDDDSDRTYVEEQRKDI